MTSRKRYWADGSEVGGQQFTYLFDDIGNRKATGGRASAVGTNAANQLNQITSRTVPGVVDVVGLANPNNDVTLQAGSGTVLTASRKGEYFSGAPVVPAPLPAYPQIQAKSLYGATQTLNAGKTYVPASPEIPTYDADGNLTSDGRWTAYVWNAENRLVEMRRDTATPRDPSKSSPSSTTTNRAASGSSFGPETAVRPERSCGPNRRTPFTCTMVGT